MSTSDPASVLLLEEQSPAGSSEVPGSLPAGVPSPELIAHLANELFSALPDSLSVPSAEVPAVSPSLPVTAPAFQPEIQFPADKHFPTLPTSAGPTQAAPVTAVYQAAPPAMPGALATGLQQLPDHPLEFSFLEEARPISGGSYPTATAPFSASDASAPSGPGSVDSRLGPSAFELSPSQLSELGSPQSQSPSASGIPFSAATQQAPIPVFSFLGELHPLSSYPPSIPGPAPAGSSDALAAAPSFGLSLPSDYQRPTEIVELASLGSYDFLDLRRPLEPAEGAGVGEPFGIEQDVPARLDLTA
jgi:cysteine desulfurase/selenocysteine lyase